MPPSHTANTADQEVMAAVDPAKTGDEYVIADISRDDAWVSCPVSAAAPLAEWC